MRLNLARCLPLLFLAPLAGAAAQPPPASDPPGPEPRAPARVVARDTPSDGGGSITIRWDPVEGIERYRIERAEADGPFEARDVAGRLADRYVDEGTGDGVVYRYRIVSIAENGLEAVSAPSMPAMSSPQWFDLKLVGVALAFLALGGLIGFFIRRAREGTDLFVRRIGGLEAVDEAVGRATEMGRTLLYVPGTGYIDNIGTVASLNLLGEVAKKTAQYGTRIRVPNRDPVVYTVAREVVKGAYTSAGVPDAFDPESVFFLVQDALAYAGAVSGIMVRERPAANFFMGPFFGESLILAETGAATGAIQIAGTDQPTQLPFFIVACDYTLIGEELYAASAYIAREPLMLGALKGQDWGKFILMVILLFGSILALITGLDIGKILFSTSGS